MLDDIMVMNTERLHAELSASGIVCLNCKDFRNALEMVYMDRSELSVNLAKLSESLEWLGSYDPKRKMQRVKIMEQAAAKW